jgi:hypothetical protein
MKSLPSPTARLLVNGDTTETTTGHAFPVEVSRGPPSFRIMPGSRLVSDREPQACDRAETFARRRSDLAVELRLGHGKELLKRVVMKDNKKSRLRSGGDGFRDCEQTYRRLTKGKKLQLE